MQNLRRMTLAGLVNVQQQFTGKMFVNFYTVVCC
jgi:hypothetical protein